MGVETGRWPQRLWGWFWQRARPVEAAASARFGGDDNSTQEPVVVFTGAPLEAQVVLGHLHSEDIPAMIQTESAGRMFGLVTGPLGEARVLVPYPLADKARHLIATAPTDDALPDDEAP